MNDTPLSSEGSLRLNNKNEWWRREELNARFPALKVRSEMFIVIRKFFNNRSFFEVDTPCLQVSPGMEPNLTAFSTELFEPFNEEKTRRLFLHTSPEFSMKKILCGGVENIFQLARVWRNGERSRLHHPEFTMLEWYRAGVSWREIANECEELFKELVLRVRKLNGLECFEWNGLKCDPLDEWEYLSVAEAFKKFCGFDILKTIPDPLRPDKDLLSIEAKKLGIRFQDCEEWDEIFYRLFLKKIEPQLGIGAPTVLYDWPLFLAALARQNPLDKRLSERFEIFVCGIELANGFGELTDAFEQRQRFEREIQQKKKMNRISYPIDQDFLNALQAGMPEASGIALGFDRLVMLCTNSKRIEDVLWAPVVKGVP